MKKKITILGSTGSIGTQALEVIEKLPEQFEIIALSAGNNIELLKKQIKKFNPKTVCVANETYIKDIKAEYPSIEVVFAEEGLKEIASNKQNDLLLVAVSGKVGLKPTIKAIENKIDIALANKETLVMAGDIVMKKAKENNVNILPVDSEHSAIHQCIRERQFVSKLIITASGGPFLNKTAEEMSNATVEQTLKHPRWNMGRKITVDSATLMNKGLEIIEAHHLFNMDYSKIEVVIHPQSVIHSLIEYNDGSVIGQFGLPSMHIPIQYAITYPQRFEGIKTNSLNLVEIAKLEFCAPDLEKFPCLKMAIEAGKNGNTYPVCLNAANEEAVFAFLKGQILVKDIAKIVEKELSSHKSIINPALEDIWEVDKN